MSATVMIVDDAAFMRMMLKDILIKNGFTVVGEAENGAVAVDKYVELQPNLTTMDITMPEMDGLQALKEIRHCLQYEVAPAVVQACYSFLHNVGKYFFHLKFIVINK